MANQETSEKKIHLLRFFQDFCFYGADQIRSSLKLSDTDFQMLSRTWSKGGRHLYIYGVLNEIEQVGIALMRSKEIFDNSDEVQEDESDPVNRRVLRNTLSTTNDVVPVDWWSGFHVRKIIRGVDVRREVREMLNYPRLDSRVLAAKVRESVTRTWEHGGLKEWVYGRAEESKQKFRKAAEELANQIKAISEKSSIVGNSSDAG